MKIGKIIKKLRGEMTQQELAKRSGLDFTTISKLEKGSLTGTITTHQKIAKALGTTLSDLYKEMDEPKKPTFEIAKGKKADKEVFYYDDKAVSQILVKQLSSRKMAPELLRLEKDGATALEQKPKGTEQFIFVLEGKIELKAGEITHQLKKGDSIYFDASEAHIIKNLSDKTSKCLKVTSPGAL